MSDAIVTSLKGILDDADAKNRLWVLSQDKKFLAPITYAEVCSANGRNPRCAEYPFVIKVCVSIFTCNTVGWYKSETEACAELSRLVDAMKNMPSDRYTVYEMN